MALKLMELVMSSPRDFLADFFTVRWQLSRRRFPYFYFAPKELPKRCSIDLLKRLKELHAVPSRLHNKKKSLHLVRAV